MAQVNCLPVWSEQQISKVQASVSRGNIIAQGLTSQRKRDETFFVTIAFYTSCSIIQKLTFLTYTTLALNGSYDSSVSSVIIFYVMLKVTIIVSGTLFYS